VAERGSPRRAGAATQTPDAFAPSYLASLRRQILACRHFTTNTLNRDFVATKGFSIVFRRGTLPRVAREFPYFQPYLERALSEECNAFYLNPLMLERGSRVDPHIDRSLRSYCKTVTTPLVVSVLYIEISLDLRGGELVLRRGSRHLARIRPVANTLVSFAGDLTHSIERVEGEGSRLSLVCEQYALTPQELEQIPELAVESRASRY
jgi:hypothetical protein